jgi:predicted nucleic acid-binding protein
MRVLLDSTLLVEGEHRRFDLGKWARDFQHETLIYDAGVVEYLAGRPVGDPNKVARWFGYWNTFIALVPSVPLDRPICEKAGELLADARSRGKTVPLGDGLHAAVAALENLAIASIDLDHFRDLQMRVFNPLEDPSGESAA